MKLKNFFTGIILAAVMVVSVIPSMSASAAEAGNTGVTIEAEATIMDVTVPTSLPIVFNEDGTNTFPTNFTITNNSALSGIFLATIRMDANESGWRLLDDTGDTKALGVGTKDIRFYAGIEGELKPVIPQTAVGKTGKASYGASEIVIPAASAQVLSFEVKRGAFHTEETIAKAFDMVLSFAFVGTPVAGLYDENDNLVISWEDLTSTEYQTVTYYDSSYHAHRDAILNVRDGRLDGCYCLISLTGNNKEFLNGKLVIDDSVTSIGYRTFYQCTGLTEVVIPDSVISLDYGAFEGCTNLTDITIPDSVNQIGRSAFQKTPWLEAKRAENPLVIVGEHVLVDGKSATGHVYVPEHVKSLAEGAFEQSAISAITFFTPITSIPNWTFNACRELKTITIPDSVTSIGNMAFNSCNNLTTIYYSGPAEGAPWGATNATVVAE